MPGEEDMDYQGLPVATVYNVGSAHMCCSACAVGAPTLRTLLWMPTGLCQEGPQEKMGSKLEGSQY